MEVKRRRSDIAIRLGPLLGNDTLRRILLGVATIVAIGCSLLSRPQIRLELSESYVDPQRCSRLALFMVPPSFPSTSQSREANII